MPFLSLMRHVSRLLNPKKMNAIIVKKKVQNFDNPLILVVIFISSKLAGQMKLFLVLILFLSPFFLNAQTVDEELISKLEKINEKYIGNYELPGKTARVTLKEEGRLWLFVPGMPECKLVFSRQHIYTLEGIPNYELEFLPSKEGTIKALIFKQPDKTVRARKKD